MTLYRNITLLLLCGVLTSCYKSTAGKTNVVDLYDKNKEKVAIVYINPDAALIPPPGYEGQRYEAMVPDTLDIAERSELAIHAMTMAADPAADYEMYFYLQVYAKQPKIMGDFSAWCQVKYWEALPLLRHATGSRLNSHVDPVWIKSMLQGIGPDGLFYQPFGGRPWFNQDLPRWYPAAFTETGGSISPDDPSISQIAHPFTGGRTMAAMTAYYLLDKNPKWKELIEAMIDKWGQLAIKEKDYAWYPYGLYLPNAKTPSDAPKVEGMFAEEGSGRIIQGLCQYYKVEPYPPALELARMLSNYLRHHGNYYDPETAAYHGSPELNMGGPGGHFHAHTIGLLGLLEYATAAGDRDYLDYVNRGYLWGRDHPYSSNTIGFFPEWLSEGYTSAEVCEIADMIALALKLTEAGAGDYYDDADRWIRNQFVESQLRRADWVYRLAKTQPEAPLGGNISTDHPAERCIGSFAGWAAANDWVVKHPHGFAIMQCCTGNAARTLYYIWQHILETTGDTLKVNLLLNRASAAADIDSYIPYTGRVDVRLKNTFKQVMIRLPEWVASKSADVACKVDGSPVTFSWHGRYIKVGDVEKNATVTVTFPIQERTVKETIGSVDYTMVIRGNTVVHIDPPGKNCPLYQRAHYRTDQPRYREKVRFVPAGQRNW